MTRDFEYLWTSTYVFAVKSDLYIKIPKHPLELVKLDMPLLFTIYPTKVLGKKLIWLIMDT